MALRSVLLCLVAVLVASPAAFAASSRNYPNPPLIFQMTPGSVDGNIVNLTVGVRSATDMPVPGVTVTLYACGFSYTTPLRVTHTRHLVRGQENLTRVGDHGLVWQLSSAPANTSAFETLHLQFRLPLNKGGPDFCITGWGYTVEGTKYTAGITVDWSLGGGK